MRKALVLAVVVFFMTISPALAEEMMGHKEGKGMTGSPVMGCGMMEMMGHHGTMGHHDMTGSGGHSMDGKKFLKTPKPLTPEEANTIMKNYLASTRNPNLKIGKAEEKEFNYETKILTKNDSLVDIILLDKNTGWLRSIY